jgi:prephenate dehydrogenase
LFDIADNEALQIASSGFRDTTRLSMTNSDLALSMFKNNQENILKHFDKLIDRLNCLKNLSDDEKIKLFKKLAQKRAKMYDSLGKNTL